MGRQQKEKKVSSSKAGKISFPDSYSKQANG